MNRNNYWLNELSLANKKHTNYQSLKDDLLLNNYDIITFKELLEFDMGYIKEFFDLDYEIENKDDILKILTNKQLNYISLHNDQLARTWNFESEEYLFKFLNNYTLPMNNYPDLISSKELELIKRHFESENKISKDRLYEIMKFNNNLIINLSIQLGKKLQKKIISEKVYKNKNLYLDVNGPEYVVYLRIIKSLTKELEYITFEEQYLYKKIAILPIANNAILFFTEINENYELEILNMDIDLITQKILKAIKEI